MGIIATKPGQRANEQNVKNSGTDGNKPEEKKPEEKKPEINYVMDWDKEIIGMERGKRSLDATLSLPLKFPSFCKGNQTVRTLLLWGPPGTGKTMLAKAFAKASNKQFQVIDPGSIMSAYWGKTAEKIKAIFDDAISNENGKIILMDELDAFGQERGGSNDGAFMRQIFTQLLQSIQDLINAPDCKSIFIGCTNTVKDLDSALRRRFSQLIFCDLPNAEERYQLLIKGIPKVERDASLSEQALRSAAIKMDLYSGSDIARLVNYLREAPMLEIQRATFFRKNNSGKWDPCVSTAPGAKMKTLQDLDDDSLGTRRCCNLADLETVTKSFRPTLTKAEYERFLKELDEIGGGDLSSRIEQVDQRNLVFENVTPEAREIDSILYDGDLSKLSPEELAREVISNHGNSLMFARRIQKFMNAALSVGEHHGICKKFFNQVKLPVFVVLLLSGFVPHLIWLLVAISSIFALLNVVAIPSYLWFAAVNEGTNLANVVPGTEETREFVILFTIALVICCGKHVVITNVALLDALVLTWTLFMLQTEIAALAGYAIFIGSYDVTKRKNFHEQLVRNRMQLRQDAANNVQPHRRRNFQAQGVAINEVADKQEE